MILNLTYKSMPFMGNETEPASKRANYPFRFFTRLTLPLLTGIYAVNLNQLIEGIKKADDGVIYYHTHHYLLQHHYIVPIAPNDFAYWIGNIYGETILSEKISAIDIFDYTAIDDYKSKIISVAEEFIKNSKKNRTARNMDMNDRFDFKKAITFIMDTGKIAYTLPEFYGTLKNITIFSFYYHYFEAHFRLNARMANDFSLWIKNELQLQELAAQISSLDPYSMTMDNLKLNIIKLIENYL